MNWIFRFWIPALILLLGACGSNPEKHNEQLEANAFRQKIASSPDAVVLDVRTPDEFAEGHIADAINVDWNGNAFDAEVEKLDRSKPVFVYCLAGGRSAAAVERMKSLGFENITELKGGMLQWRANKLPETGLQDPEDTGMTSEEFRELVAGDRLVLVDFYAEWCGPCKKMEPILEEIAAERKATVKVVRIDVDANSGIAQSMGVKMLPTLLLLKDNAVIWSKTGFTTKEELLDRLK